MTALPPSLAGAIQDRRTWPEDVRLCTLPGALGTCAAAGTAEMRGDDAGELPLWLLAMTSIQYVVPGVRLDRVQLVAATVHVARCVPPTESSKARAV